MNINPAALHRLKNQLSIIVGFCELLLEDAAPGEQRHTDLLHIQQAAQSALAELPRLPAHEFGSTLEPPPEITDED